MFGPEKLENMMKANVRRLLNGLAALSIGLVSAQAKAAAIGVADIHLDWSSVSIVAGPGLSMVFDPLSGGQFSNVAHLGVSQGQLNSVPVPSADLQPFNLSYQPVNSLRTINYSLGDSISSISADISTDRTGASLHVTASDNDGNLFQNDFINAYVAHGARYIVSGTGTLDVSFNYLMALTNSGVAGFDFSNVYGTVSLTLQDYAPNPAGGYDFLGTFQDSFTRQVTDNFSQGGTLALALPFDNATEHLVLLEMNGTGIPFANSAAIVAAVPEAGTINLMLAGLAGMGVMRRRRAA